jgi:hypothetical protein
MSLPNIITSHFLTMFYNDWYNIHRGLLCTLFINWFLYRKIFIFKRCGVYVFVWWVDVFLCWGSCIYVLGVMYLCVEGNVFMCWGSCIYVLGVMYLCVGVMYFCVGGHVFMNGWPHHKNWRPPTRKCKASNT